VPPEVAARLDAALADLVADRAGEPNHAEEPSTVVPLRRRRWPAALLAAATVAAVGFGTAQVLTTGSGGDAASPASQGEAEEAAREEAGAADEDAADGESLRRTARDRAEEAPVPQSGLDTAAQLPTSLEDLLDGSVTLGEGPWLELNLSALPEELSADDRRTAAYAVRACGPRRPVPGAARVPVRYDDRPALLVVQPGWAGFRIAEVYLCDGQRPHRVVASVLLGPGS